MTVPTNKHEIKKVIHLHHHHVLRITVSNETQRGRLGIWDTRGFLEQEIYQVFKNALFYFRKCLQYL